MTAAPPPPPPPDPARAESLLADYLDAAGEALPPAPPPRAATSRRARVEGLMSVRSGGGVVEGVAALRHAGRRAMRMAAGPASVGRL